MAISYEPLEITLIKKKLNREMLRKEGLLSPATLAKFRKNAYVNLEVIDRLCERLDCEIQDIVKYVPNCNVTK